MKENQGDKLSFSFGGRQEGSIMNTRKPQLNISISDETLLLLEELKRTFGVETNAAVVKRALSLARLASRNQRDDHTITFLGKDNVKRDIVLNG